MIGAQGIHPIITQKGVARVRDTHQQEQSSMELSDQLIDEVPLAVLDTETTGLESALGHRTIELAILRLENWQEVGSFNQLINPGRTIPPSASRINHIHDVDVANAPPFVDYADDIAELLQGALVVAHNATFDAGFISAEWTLTGRPPLLNQCACTLLIARRQFSFWRNSLGEVARELGVRTGRAHRAMNDTWMTSQILRRMLIDLNQWGICTVGELVHAQGGPIRFHPPLSIDLPPPLGKAVRNRSPIGIRYLDNSGATTERVIEPYYMSNHRGDDYLIAFCRLRNSQRTFRVDRILGAFPA